MKLIKALSRSSSKPTPGPEVDASILSPDGEGYCQHCQFVVGLTPGGYMDAHRRGSNGAGEGRLCKGSGRRPASRTPYSSRKAAFRVNVPGVWCPTCQQSVRPLRKAGESVYPWHSYPPVVPGEVAVTCPQSYKVIPAA